MAFSVAGLTGGDAGGEGNFVEGRGPAGIVVIAIADRQAALPVCFDEDEATEFGRGASSGEVVVDGMLVVERMVGGAPCEGGDLRLRVEVDVGVDD